MIVSRLIRSLPRVSRPQSHPPFAPLLIFDEGGARTGLRISILPRVFLGIVFGACVFLPSAMADDALAAKVDVPPNPVSARPPFSPASVSPMSDPVAVRWAVAPCTQKIFPDTPPVGPVEARLVAARGEVVSFQILVRASADADGPATLPVSHTTPGVDLFVAHWIETPGVAQWGYPEEFPRHRRTVYPDPLVPVSEGGNIVLRPDETRALWVRIDATAAPAASLASASSSPSPVGLLSPSSPSMLQGVVRVGLHDVPFRVEILPFALPTTPSLTTGIGLGGRGFARIHGVEPYSEAYWDLYEKYYRALLDYRLNATRLPRSPSDPRAKSYLIDPRVTSFIADYSNDRDAMRVQCEEFARLGVARKAWFYNIDEPDTSEQYAVVRDQARYLRTVCPAPRYGLPFYTGLPDKSTPFDHLAGDVNPWVIQTDYYAHGHGLGDKIRRQARERHEAGDEIWLYTALAPRGGWCNLLLNHTALEHRLLFWQIYAEAIVTGYLFWQSTYWDEIEDPWTDQATVKSLDPHLWGDGSFFYPGATGPVGSIRLELMRAGLQDYELLKQAEALLGREATMEHVRRLTTDFTRYTDDSALFEGVRRELQRALVEGLARRESPSSSLPSD